MSSRSLDDLPQPGPARSAVKARNMRRALQLCGSRLLQPSCPAPFVRSLDVGPTRQVMAAAHDTADPFKGVLIDAAGTLLSPAQPVVDVYCQCAEEAGIHVDRNVVLANYRRAYSKPWPGSPIRYVGDGRPFWRHIVTETTGSDCPRLFEAVYNYYLQPQAWKLSPGVETSLQRMRSAGLKLAVVSNFDTRLRPILDGLKIGHLFDAVIVSAEVGAEKPNPVIFEAACSALNLSPDDVVHVGDDRRNDVWGARDAGILAWLWGVDVTSFEQVANKVLAEGQTEDD